MASTDKSTKILKLKVNTDNSAKELLKSWQDKAWKLANATIEGIVSVQNTYQSITWNHPETKEEYEQIVRAIEVVTDKSERKKLFNRKQQLERIASDALSEFIGKGSSEPNLIYRHVKRSIYAEGVPSMIFNSIKDKVHKNWKQRKIEIANGQSSLPSYKAGMPVDFVKKSIRDWKIHDENTISFYFMKQLTNSSGFYIEFGKDKSNKRAIVENIIKGNYHLCDSSYVVDGEDIYFNFCFQLPKEPIKAKGNFVMGVDFGMRCPMAYAVVEVIDDKCVPTKIRGRLGVTEKIIAKEKSLKKKRQKSQIHMTFAPGGKGRKNKTKNHATVKNNIAGYRKNVLDTLSKAIVDICCREGIKTIKIENLKGLAKSKSFKALGISFPYHMTKTLLINKAQHHSIDVIEVPAAYTSKTCHACGEVNDELKKQERWECNSCKARHNRDINAAYNIAMKDVKVLKKNETKIEIVTE